MKLLSKVKTFLWFAVRPLFWPQLKQLWKRNLNPELEDSRAESTNWCKSIAISPKEALMTLGVEVEYKSLEELFPDIISTAKQKESEAIIKMGGEGAISFLYHLVKSHELRSIIESGVAYGWSSLALLLAIKDQPNGKLISNDMPYVKMNNEDFVGCIVPESLRFKWELQRLPDVSGLPKAFNKFSGEIDLFHYDSDKSYTGRMWASPLIWENLRNGGFFVSDDINDNLAFKHFSLEVDRNPIVIEHLGKYVGIIRK